MSRHRNVRNLRRGDFEFEDDDGYMSSEPEDEYNEDTAAYMWRGGNDAHTFSEYDPAAQKEVQYGEQLDANALLEDLAQGFRAILGRDVERAILDAALVAANYDVSAALESLRVAAEHSKQTPANCAHPLENQKPSAIGIMLVESANSNQREHQVLPEPPVQTAQNAQPFFEGRTAVVCATDSADIVPFDFSTPSPDDLIREKQSTGRERVVSALRLPPPSSRVAAKKESAPNNEKVTQPDTSGAVSGQEKKPTSRVPGANKLRRPLLRKGAALNAAVAATEANSKQSSIVKEQPQKKVVQRLKKVDVAAVTAKSEEVSSISVVIAGHVDAGKSTLLGHLMNLVGGTTTTTASGSKNAKRGRRKPTDENLAWLMDEDAVERAKGVTIDICTRIFETKTNGRTRHFAMVDAPGHRDFVPAMILGTMQATAAVLVVDASTGEFEAGISEGGQTREHAILLRSMGISRLLVAINKLDTVSFSRARYENVKTSMQLILRNAGWRGNDVSYIPVSGRDGINLTKPPPGNHELKNWYSEGTLLEVLERMADSEAAIALERAEALQKQPTRFMVSDSFRSASLGGVMAVSGRLLTGSLAPRDRLSVCPSQELATVKNIEIGGTKGRAEVAVAGLHSLPISLGLAGIPDTLLVSPGNILCDPAAQVPIVSRFRAQIVVIASPVPLLQGSAVELHVAGGSEAASLYKLVELLGGKGEGRSAKKRPRRLVKFDSAIVEVKCERPVCLELSSDVKNLGRFSLRASGLTVAAGVVTEIVRKANTGKKSEKSDSSPSEKDLEVT